MEATTYQEVQGLSRMTVGELRGKYLEVFGEETRSYHKEFLRKRIAWRIQAHAEGDLSERARRRAEELANDADLRTRAPRDPVASGSAEVKARTATGRISPSRDPRLPLPGTLLAREFQGRDVVVKVLDNGFEFDGHRFKSLSAIAQEITGSKWNGFLFFGIADGAAKALNGRAASSRKRSFDPQSARYDFRVFLLHLGLIGDEFKTARKHLIAALPGDSAFKRGRVKPDEQTAPKAEPLTEAGPETRPSAFSGDETGGAQGGAS